MEPPTYRIACISQSEGLRGTKKSIPGSGDATECRDCSGLVADMKQENRLDPSDNVTLIGCAHCGHTVVKTQAIQGTWCCSWIINNMRTISPLMLNI